MSDNALAERLEKYLSELDDTEAQKLIEQLTLDKDDILETDIDKDNTAASTNNILAVLSDRRF